MEASPNEKADDFSEEQLEQILADCRLRCEQSLFSSSATNTEYAKDDDVPAIGPISLLDVLSPCQSTLVTNLLLYHILPSTRSDVT